MYANRCTKRGIAAAALLGLLLVIATAALAADQTKAPAKTVENLQAAFNGESNAHARYLAFAEKADLEGYAGVATLFRAAARAEQVHANSHAAVIKEMGAVPAADVKTPEVKSTRENLEAAIKGETYERDTMYPEFLKLAKAEANKGAVKSFNYAKTAEAEHAKLYRNALDDMNAWKTAKPMYVCTVCGYTTTALSFEKCPSCFNPKSKYVEVS